MTDKTKQAMVKHVQSLNDRPIEKAVYEAFRYAIVTGGLPLHQRINTTEYAQVLNTSRTPIRLALDKLLADGLVYYTPNIGFFACQVTMDDAREIYLIRKALEAVVVNVATEKMTPADFDELEGLLQATDEANKRNDIAQVLVLFREYHRFMYQKSELHRIAEIISRGDEYLQHFRTICLSHESRRNHAIADHWAIYHAMKARDTQTTVGLIEGHLDASLDFLLANFDDRGVYD